MRRLRHRPLWLFIVASLGVASLGACGDKGPGGYSTTKPHPGGNDDEKDAGDDEGNDGGAGNGSAGKGGGDEGGRGGSDSVGMDGGESGSGGGGGGGESGGGAGDDGAGEGGGGEGGSPAVELPDSPANPWIAFVEIVSGFGQLSFIKADGTGLHAYAGNTFAETEPAWSPDGMKLAFTAVSETDGAQLHVLDFDTGSDDVLDIDLGTMTRPRWTPDGDTIVFAGAETAGAKSALYRTDAVDGGATAITEPEQGDGGHDIGPDGTIYFSRKLDNNTFDIFSIDVEATPSTDPTRVTTGSSIIGGVAVHPAGTHVMYAKATTSSTQLVERSLSDGTERNIGEEGDEEPAYFAGADGLVIDRDSFDADSEIAVCDADGVLSLRVTDSDPFDTAPAVSSIESDDVDVEQF